ncbi:MAG: hypothetical protein JWO86_6895 [Myxococcaceae bacterium]|nr:hypothetical protein [Myxococcaceae bacterium]MEA2752189.1 hypothetical protein [Myxococcales bacterium]
MFDPSAARARLDRLWKLKAQFGAERGANRVFLDEIVSDRLQLVWGMQLLRDELQFAPSPAVEDREEARADLTLPSVVTTIAFTNCGDRVHQGEVDRYVQTVASRFATISELGVLKPEAFRPTGGGTDDGATLAHVTWAHVLDEPLRKRVYDGNAKSYVACGFDLKTHIGRLDTTDGNVRFGTTQESPWREPRAACGAIMGTLNGFDENNDVHWRIRQNLGNESFAFLTKEGVRTVEGIDITATVAASIVAVQGMLDTARALQHELDERGVAHLTASLTVNRSAIADTMIYLARATVFGGESIHQGFGVDARRYGGALVARESDRRLHLSYDGLTGDGFPIVTDRYDVRRSILPGDLFV